MSNSKSSGSGCTVFALLLFVTLATLKLGGAISLSWWWVTAPLWGPWALLVVFFALIAIGVGSIAVAVGIGACCQFLVDFMKTVGDP